MFGLESFEDIIPHLKMDVTWFQYQKVTAKECNSMRFFFYFYDIFSGKKKSENCILVGSSLDKFLSFIFFSTYRFRF